MIDKTYEKISDYLGSTITVSLFAAWLCYHTATQRDYISFISELAILIGLMILRAESAQSARLERIMRRDERKTKEVLKKVK